MTLRPFALAVALLAFPLPSAHAAEPSPNVPEAPRADATPKDEVWRVSVGKAPTRGPRDALVTVVVWSDFECSFCRRLAGTFDELARRYPNDVRFVFKHHPLPMHANAMAAAELAEEARAQGKDAAFFRVHDALFKAERLSEESLLEIAAAERLDVARVKKAFASERHRKVIAADVDESELLDAGGTPTSFVNGVRVIGAQPLERFVEVIDTELAKARTLVDAGTPRSKLHDRIVANGKVTPEPEFERRSVPQPTAATPTRGPAKAPVTLHLFTDFECPYCAGARETLEEMERRYRGKVRLAYHSLPLGFHRHARDAATFALEAFSQRGSAGFWRAHDLLFANQARLTHEDLLDHARTLQLDVDKVKAALETHAHDAAIDADMALARSLQINGTPTFVVNDLEIRGAETARVFQAAIDRALREAKGPTAGAPAKK